MAPASATTHNDREGRMEALSPMAQVAAVVMIGLVALAFIVFVLGRM